MCHNIIHSKLIKTFKNCRLCIWKCSILLDDVEISTQGNIESKVIQEYYYTYLPSVQVSDEVGNIWSHLTYTWQRLIELKIMSPNHEDLINIWQKCHHHHYSQSDECNNSSSFILLTFCTFPTYLFLFYWGLDIIILMFCHLIVA